jgi:hypothetical protein
MRRLFALALILSLSFLSLALSPVYAASISYSGTLDASDPLFNRPDETCCSLSGTTAYFESQDFYVDVSGLYTMTMTAGTFAPSGAPDDGFFVLYTDFVDANNPLLNWYNADDAGGVGNLPEVVEYLDAGAAYTLVATTFDPLALGSYSVTITGPGNITLGRLARPGFFSDGRVNNSVFLDGGAPVAIYCRADGAIDVYFISQSSSRGRFLFRVTAARIAEVGVPTERNALLGFVGSVMLHRLTTGEFQVNATNFDGTPYAVVWNGCPSTGYYHPDRQWAR